jgi:methylated-DNA-protein-cysteine methyltransferase-like protein
MTDGKQPDAKFRENVYELVATIPAGKVMTYGDIAGFCGHAYAARIVGGLAHFGPPDLPWQRVVNRFGGLAAGYPGGRVAHKRDLEDEGVLVNNEFIIEDFGERRWQPDQTRLF